MYKFNQNKNDANSLVTEKDGIDWNQIKKTIALITIGLGVHVSQIKKPD